MDTAPYPDSPPSTYYAHEAEAALRAAKACHAAEAIFLHILLAEQLPPDPEKQERRFKTAQMHLRNAQAWIERARTKPE